MDQTIVERVAIAERPGDDDESPAYGHDEAATDRFPREFWLIFAIVFVSYANALWHLFG
jgi:hypothetical protein